MGNTKKLVACIAVSTVLGSIHAFSVLIPDWETSLAQSRGSISFVYSLSLGFLTLAVLFGHHLFRLLTPAQIFILVAAGSSTGLLLAASATSIVTVYISYGILFGTANGIGYGYALQLAGQIAGKRHAVSMSLVTAFYAVGAAGASPVFQFTTGIGGNKLTLITAAATIFIVCVIAGITTAITKTTFESEPAGTVKAISASQRQLRLMMWLVYGTAVTAGLMVIGHAYPILHAKHAATENAAIAPMLVAIGNIIGGLNIGYLALKFSHKTVLLAFSVLSFCGLFMIAVPAGNLYGLTLFGLTLIGLTLIGVSYGAIIAVYPVVVADRFGKQSSARIYGQIFTAWGLAGLIAPTLSGILFDVSGTYTMSLLLAVALCVVSMFVILRRF